MAKRLQELTKEEWNTLFPIELVTHNPKWKGIFEAEKRRIFEETGDLEIRRIEHFGSTAIPDIQAKPYIDMLIEIPEGLLFDSSLIDHFTALGYHYFPQSHDTADYMVFVKGYHMDGIKEQIFHIHMCAGHHDLWDQIRFRDALVTSPEKAMAYEELKLELAENFRNDRVGYRMAKSEFINEILEELG